MSSFEFNFAPSHEDINKNNKNSNINLEEIMHKINLDESDGQFKFDHFDDVDNAPHQTSGSDFFSRSHKSSKKEEFKQSAKSKEDSKEFEFENSRNLNEISLIENVKNESFRFESSPVNSKGSLDSNNQRYQNLQKLFNKAKTNSLDQFYKNLDQQNAYRVEEKFRSKDEFKLYRNELKSFKKSLEEDFQNQNGNYNFRDNQYRVAPTAQKPERRQQPKQVDDFFASNNNYNFKKKQSSKPEGKNFIKSSGPIDFFDEQPNNRNYFLPSALQQEDDDPDLRQLKPQDINQQIKKYEQSQYNKQAGDFFAEQSKKKKAQKPAKKLPIINQERANIFQNTQEEQKMSKLLNNYQELKSNFNNLMYNLKQTNTDQEKIITELKQLKVEYENKESRMKVQEQSKKEKQIIKEKEKEEKYKKITEIKEEIHKIKENNDKDVLILKLNEKVENLEEILKNAIQELHQEKQPKMIPKIINYYNEPEPKPESSRSRSRYSNQVNFSGEEEPENLNNSQINKLDQNYYLGPVRNAIKQLKEEKREQPMNFTDEFSSPLQLDLTVQDYPLNISRGRSQQFEQPFIPADNSKQYQPNALDVNNKLLRRCLTQKSSVIFESFQFYVTGKYTITGNDRFPVTCEVRVANKCAINLYDIFVVVYGPQAQSAELQMRPSKIMYDEFKANTSFLFEVDLSKSCIEVGSFNVQLSYKDDCGRKKKVNFKAVLPFAQLIKPEFIYEEQFVNAWNHMENEYYVKPKLLDFKNIRSHEDLKLILPFMEINEPDPNSFSYGIMFSYPKSATAFMLKVTCYVSGKASIHLKSSQANQSVDKRLRQQILDILCYLIFG